jgi:RNA polymerase sigma factor (sigma-70 family)
MTIFVSDENLLLGFRAGDKAALSRVYCHYVDAVETLLRRYLAVAAGGRWRTSARSDLSDVLQEAFVKAFAPAARLAYDRRREYRPFLMAIARNALVDHLRGASREIRWEGSAIEALISGESDAVDVDPWADPHTISLAERYIASLSDPERHVYEQRYVRCHSQEHCALALGMTRQRVRTIEGKLRGGLARAIYRANLGASITRGGTGEKRLPVCADESVEFSSP